MLGYHYDPKLNQHLTLKFVELYQHNCQVEHMNCLRIPKNELLFSSNKYYCGNGGTVLISIL